MMAKSVRPRAGTTSGLSKAQQPENPIRTLLADPIRASSPNRLHKQAGQTTAPDGTSDHHFMLATREPSTDDIPKSAKMEREESDQLPHQIIGGQLNQAKRCQAASFGEVDAA